MALETTGMLEGVLGAAEGVGVLEGKMGTPEGEPGTLEGEPGTLEGVLGLMLDGEAGVELAQDLSKKEYGLDLSVSRFPALVGLLAWIGIWMTVLGWCRSRSLIGIVGWRWNETYTAAEYTKQALLPNA